MIDAASRLKGVEQLIDRNQYFVIHAARQSGKTTYLQDLTKRVNAAGRYYALYCSLEGVQNITDPKMGIPVVLDCITIALQKSSIPFTYDDRYEQEKKNRPLVLLTLFLMDLVKSMDKPLVVFFDEADCLSENTLISFLRQLRSGYNDRSMAPFVHSLALVGMRNIRDFKARIRPDSESLGSASPFNIVAESLTLKNFTKEEITQLYQQHTDETGQHFDGDAIELVWEQTQGQPWLVNAIAREVIEKKLQSDYTIPVTAAMVKEAIQTIILNRPTHLDSLMERLKEPRVRRVIYPMMIGEVIPDKSSNDFLYVRDLGLIREVDSVVMPGNPVYAEVIVRMLSSMAQEEFKAERYPYKLPRYINGSGLDMDYLMRDFQQFWRENSEIWRKKHDYEEAAPHIVLMAFLQRIVNGGGQIIREMAAGTGRLDLCVIYGDRKYPIELKIKYDRHTLPQGLEQTLRYMNKYGCSEAWLALCDRENPDWDDKIYMRKETVDGKTITIVGL
jgi:hypothetical protein